MALRELEHPAGTNNGTAAGGSTLLLDCPVCRSDVAETLGVAGGGGENGAAVVMCCGECGTVYLSPPRSDSPAGQPSPSRSLPIAGLARRWLRGLPRDARALHIRSPIAAADGQQYELVVLNRALEQAPDPAGLLREAARMLSAGGRIIVIADNAGSACFATFGGRHWWGYGPPGARQQFSAEGLMRLGAVSGLRTCRIVSQFSARAWLESARRWLSDWDAGSLLTAVLAGRWPAPLAIAGAAEAIAILRGRGAILVAEMVPA